MTEENARKGTEKTLLTVNIVERVLIAIKLNIRYRS